MRAIMRLQFQHIPAMPNPLLFDAAHPIVKYANKGRTVNAIPRSFYV